MNFITLSDFQGTASGQLLERTPAEIEALQMLRHGRSMTNANATVEKNYNRDKGSFRSAARAAGTRSRTSHRPGASLKAGMGDITRYVGKVKEIIPQGRALYDALFRGKGDVIDSTAPSSPPEQPPPASEPDAGADKGMSMGTVALLGLGALLLFGGRR